MNTTKDGANAPSLFYLRALFFRPSRHASAICLSSAIRRSTPSAIARTRPHQCVRDAFTGEHLRDRLIHIGQLLEMDWSKKDASVSYSSWCFLNGLHITSLPEHICTVRRPLYPKPCSNSRSADMQTRYCRTSPLAIHKYHPAFKSIMPSIDPFVSSALPSAHSNSAYHQRFITDILSPMLSLIISTFIATFTFE